MKTLKILFEKFYDSVGLIVNDGKSIAPVELKSFK